MTQPTAPLPDDALTVYSRLGARGLLERVAVGMCPAGEYVCPRCAGTDQPGLCLECKATGMVALLREGEWVAMLVGRVDPRPHAPEWEGWLCKSEDGNDRRRGPWWKP